jgi:hypothetical protein
MKPLRYGANEIRAWAEFSGDFNPVHFDLAAAARLGLPAVPVHGMRVMLDVASALYRDACAQAAALSEPWLFKATLRAPVLCGAAYQLHIKRSERRHGFSVIEDSGGKTCINGYLRQATASEAAPGEPGGDAMASVLRKSDLLRDITRFIVLSDHAQPAWLLLDALLFRHLLQLEGEPFGGIARALGIDDVNSAHGLMGRVTVLQTHHATLITPLAQQFTPEMLVDQAGAGALRFENSMAVTTDPTPGGLAIGGSLTAWSGDRLLVRTSVGLLALTHSSPP